MTRSFLPLRALFLTVFLVFFTSGCGKKDVYPVSGQIVDMDGHPVTKLQGGSIQFECLDARSSATGAIDAEGKFQLMTLQPGDGAHVGKQRVTINRRAGGPETPTPPVLDPKYEDTAKTDLEVTVEPKNNTFELKVQLYKKK